MKFNPGLQKFEPVLPEKKSKVKIERNKNNLLLYYLIAILVLLGLSFLVVFLTR